MNETQTLASSALDADKPWCRKCRQHTEWKLKWIASSDGTGGRRSCVCVICQKSMFSPTDALKIGNRFILTSKWFGGIFFLITPYLLYDSGLLDSGFPDLGWSWVLILLMPVGFPAMFYLYGRAFKKGFHDNWREWAEKWEEGDAHNTNLRVHHEKQGKEDEEEKASCLLIFLGLWVIPLTCLWLFCASILDYERYGWHVVGGVVLLFAVYYIWNFIRGKK